MKRGRRKENKTHCIHGHPYTPENTYRTKKGSYACRVCMRYRLGKRHRDRSRKAMGAEVGISVESPMATLESVVNAAIKMETGKL